MPVKEPLRDAQRRLEAFYELEQGPDVTEFLHIGADDQRETVLVRQTGDTLELAVILPPHQSQHHGEAVTDLSMQLFEGVSHFVYLAERARTELPATRLELELQAEIDKFVLLALDGDPLPVRRARGLHERLYARVRHLHPPDTEAGHRYRLANHLAARLASRLVDQQNPEEARRLLRRFYRAGQTEKIHLARAA